MSAVWVTAWVYVRESDVVKNARSCVEVGMRGSRVVTSYAMMMAIPALMEECPGK